MDEESWRRAERLFHQVLELPPSARGAYLDHACGGDAALRREVEALVSSDGAAASFLDRPVLAPLAGSPGPQVSLVGRQLGPYRVLGLLGTGGMGEVYRAHDERLGRDVAIKTLPPELAHDEARLVRLRNEARALAALNHPGVAAIHAIEESDGLSYLVLELVEGEPLRGPLAVSLALDRAAQLAAALQAAHEQGIVHRDLKPANIKVTPQGRVKVLDFGLAKEVRSGPAPQTERVTTSGGATASSLVVGTPGYMSPEQVRGGRVDERADVWAFGCLLFELLAGQQAFQGQTVSDAIAAVLDREPDWRALPTTTPPEIRALLRRCLEKEVGGRLPSMANARAAIERACRPRRGVLAAVRQPRVAVPAAVVLLGFALLGLRQQQHASRVRFVRQQAIPEIARLVEAGELAAAFRLLRRAKATLPDDPELRRIDDANSFETAIVTQPAGAEVWATSYAAGDEDWIRLGATPLATRELWLGYYRFRLVKPGYQTVLGTGEVRGATTLRFDLDAEGALPPKMVRVPAGGVTVPGVGHLAVGSFLIDRAETTNAEFHDFIAQGGYRRREYWKEAFVDAGRPIPWEGAMQRFRDATGLPGPSTWEFGEFPQGQGDYPVNGVSWYEAAAYAEFVGKQLPTLFHWQRAANPGWFADITEVSNIGGGDGTVRVASRPGLGAYGTFDMAGNVREWCWNQISGRRVTRGGAWNEPAYTFTTLDARDAWDRSAQNGVRCVRYDARAEAALRQGVTRPVRDFGRETPVRDDVFTLYKSLYAYDAVDLDAHVDGVDQDNPHWRRERVSFAAVYGGERITGYLYVPKRAKPPYQTIVYACMGIALRLPAPHPGEERFYDFLVRSGRAFFLPVLKGHYQRRYPAPPAGPHEARDRLILESKDFRRCLDYLVSRPDIDRRRLGVYGISRGMLVPVLAVGEDRLKAAVLVSVGLTFDRVLPEADPFNFLPRFRVPTLMVCGRSDFSLPFETSQRPMFRLLGAPEEDKRLASWPGGHFPPSFRTAVREALGWYDRYLGPVAPR